MNSFLSGAQNYYNTPAVSEMASAALSSTISLLLLLLLYFVLLALLVGWCGIVLIIMDILSA